MDIYMDAPPIRVSGATPPARSQGLALKPRKTWAESSMGQWPPVN